MKSKKQQKYEDIWVKNPTKENAGYLPTLDLGPFLDIIRKEKSLSKKSCVYFPRYRKNFDGNLIDVQEEYQKAYHEQNKEKINAYQKARYEQNIDRILKMKSELEDDKLITVKDALELFGISPTTLRNWRYHKRNPLPCVKEKNLVFYKLSDLKKRMEYEKKKPEINNRQHFAPKDKPMNLYIKNERNLIGVVYEDLIPKSRRKG